jgi:MFS family permease
MIRRPAAILALLTGLNFLNYLDRILVAAVLPKISADLGLTKFEGGLLATVFLLGYFVTSPLFGVMADRGARKGLIAFGVAVWSLATAASGLATGLATMLLARAVVGIGEASYATLAPTIIDDITPPEKKGKALAIFYLATPLGSALGFVLGGLIEKQWGWRAVFYVAGGPGLLLAVTCLFIAEPARRLASTRTSVWASAKALLAIPLYRRTVIGYTAHTAALGAFAHWGPTFLHERYDLDLKSANFWFGAVTVAAGAIGTIVGGALGRSRPGPPPDHRRSRRGRDPARHQRALAHLRDRRGLRGAIRGRGLRVAVGHRVLRPGVLRRDRRVLVDLAGQRRAPAHGPRGAARQLDGGRDLHDPHLRRPGLAAGGGPAPGPPADRVGDDGAAGLDRGGRGPVVAAAARGRVVARPAWTDYGSPCPTAWPASRRRTSCSTPTTRSTGTRGAPRPSPWRPSSIGRCSCRSATPPVTGATSWPTRASRIRRPRRS